MYVCIHVRVYACVYQNALYSAILVACKCNYYLTERNQSVLRQFANVCCKTSEAAVGTFNGVGPVLQEDGQQCEKS